MFMPAYDEVPTRCASNQTRATGCEDTVVTPKTVGTSVYALRAAWRPLGRATAEAEAAEEAAGAEEAQGPKRSQQQTDARAGPCFAQHFIYQTYLAASMGKHLSPDMLDH